MLVSTVANGAMVAHSDLAFVIDSQGRQRDALIDDPGPTQASPRRSPRSSWAGSTNVSIREVATPKTATRPPAGWARSLSILAACVLSGLAPAPPAPRPARAATGERPLDARWLLVSCRWASSDQANTFWQVLHAEPGSSHWASVTPQGVADNGGLVAGGVGGGGRGRRPAQSICCASLRSP